jgi:hypothetical protein
MEEDYKVQSVIFDKTKYTLKEAKKWLKENNYKMPKVDEKENTLRFRQEDPDEVEKMGFTEYRTKDLGNGDIKLIIVYKSNKKISPYNIKKMPKFKKGSQEAKDYMAKIRKMKGSGMCGGSMNYPTSIHPASTTIERHPHIGASQCCNICKSEMDMEGGRINIGKAFKKLGKDIKKGFNKEIAKPAEKVIVKDIGGYVTKKKGGLATDLIKFGIPAVAGATLGAVGSLAGPVSGVAGSALGSKLGSMGASELRKKTGTGFKKGSQEAKDHMARIRAMRRKN